MCVWTVLGGGRVLDERLDSLIMFLERDKFHFLRERVENMRKHFYNETPKPDPLHHGISVPSTPSVPGVTRARSLDHSSSNSRNDVGSKSMSGYSRPSPGQLVSDPWSEEAPSGGVFALDHIEKRLTRGVSMPHSRPSTPGSRLESSEHNSFRVVENNNDSHTMASSSASSLVGGRENSSQAVSSTYTPPHLRDKTVAPVSGQSGVASSYSQLPTLEGRSGSYAPPHLRRSNSFNPTSPTGLSVSRHDTDSQTSVDLGNESVPGNSPRDSLNGHSLLPYGSSDFLDFNPEPEELPTLSGPRKGTEHDGQSEEVKSLGSQRQAGICAVCSRDAANTVRA